MNRLEKHVERILNEMQSSKEERAEIKEEMLAHLYEMRMEYEDKGESRKQAEKMALSEFGGAGMIGNGLQESLYPYQRSLLYVIGIATIILGILLHFALLDFFHEPSPIWLFIQLTFGTMVTLVAMNISYLGKFYWSVNVLLFLTAALNGFDYFIIVQFEPVQLWLFLVYITILILLCLIFVIRHSYYYSIDFNNRKKDRTWKIVSQVINILYGVLISGAALFFLYGFLIFAGTSWIMAIPIFVVFIWLVFYKYQMNLIRDKPVTAIFTGLLFVTLVVAVPFVLSL
ncbi:permease prefix domain 1-containing protein [Halobacillus rhizosphaerae]|uniref:permease prefix domain 1-containing protein n=1 Tax=Halobacillus rhizosphaerae TaxID=3064889 RepID=UPI00398AF4DF